MKIIIIGAGIIGINIAFFLKKFNNKIIIIERKSNISKETSFANGCQISISHIIPLSNNIILLNMLKFFKKKNKSLIFFLKLNWYYWKWIINFFFECVIYKNYKNILQILSICKYSKKTLYYIKKKINKDYNQLTNGILYIYTNKFEYNIYKNIIKLINKIIFYKKKIKKKKIIKLESSLFFIYNKIIKSYISNLDESGNIYKLINFLKKKKYNFIKYLFNSNITKFLIKKKKILGIEIINNKGFYKIIKSNKYILSTGIFSKSLLNILKINILIYPVKGYSITYNIIKNKKLPLISLIDNEYKLVISKIGNKLRIAGIFEFNSYNFLIKKNICNIINKRIKFIFPYINRFKYSYWSNLRPITPSNIPYIGKTLFKNFFINIGHGILGFTMSFGSGLVISEIINGNIPNINFIFHNINNKFIKF